MRNPYQIVHTLLVTEKGTELIDEHNQYTFRVASDANKIEIRRAVEQVFKVKVKSVRTANILGKPKRWGRSLGRRPHWKKAYVQLVEGEKTIEYFEGL